MKTTEQNVLLFQQMEQNERTKNTRTNKQKISNK